MADYGLQHPSDISLEAKRNRPVPEKDAAPGVEPCPDPVDLIDKVEQLAAEAGCWERLRKLVDWLEGHA